MNQFWVRSLLILLASGMVFSFSSCKSGHGTDETDSSSDPGVQTEETEDNTRESETTDVETNTRYEYPKEEYTAQIGLFEPREQNFAPGSRSKSLITIEDEGDIYAQSRDAIQVDGVRTYASVDRAYSPAMQVRVDAYVVSSDYAPEYRKYGYDIIGMSGSFMKTDYTDTFPKYLQYNSKGTTDGLWGSAVLFKEVVEYNIRKDFSTQVRTSNWRVGYVEPEMFRDGVYGDTYKEMWGVKYGENWADPTQSPRSMFLSQRLNVWFLTNAIKMYVSSMNKKMTDDNPILFSVSPHSTLAYATLQNGVTDGYVHMMGTGLVKSVTGQTWSNTIENSIRFEGKRQKMTFLNALVDYGTYLDAADYYGAEFFALCDPMSDTFATKDEGYWRALCHEQLVASLMYPEINRWEFIWTNRSFMNVSQEYRSEQLNLHRAMQDISGKAFRLEAGTPGVTYLLGDTLTWQSSNTAWGNVPYDGFWGVAAPLVTEGIPLRTRAMELVTSAKDLEGVSLLIVSYDNQKPLYEETNKAIAEWVRDGGTLLYLGGPDSYLDVEEAFWNREGKGGSPTGNLLMHLGLSGSVSADAAGSAAKGQKLVFVPGKNGLPSEGFTDGEMKIESDKFTYVYTGSGFEPLLKTESGLNVGVEADVGKGHVLLVGLPTTDYSGSASGSALMRMLTAYALNYTSYEYRSADAYVAQRGDYVCVYPLRGSYTLKGTYLNIFSSDLSYVVNPVVQEGEAALYLRVPSRNDVQVPTVLFDGSLSCEKTESDRKTVLTLTAAENALIPVSVLAPAGLAPVKIEAYYGDLETACASSFDAGTGVLTLSAFGSSANPLTVEITWGDGSAPKSSSYTKVHIAVNSSGQDEAYLVSNQGSAAGDRRYCDGAAQIVWKFDLKGKTAPVLAIDVVSNYLIEISGDGTNYVKLADFKDFSSIRATATNQGVLTVFADAYEQVGDSLYVRLSNNNPGSGWGGGISAFTLYELTD
ncbi:MAG: hypothetical protein IJU20_05960 [Clostridia bacterium]|nr:hypothetical protein [Clostridia bacterium]